MKSSTAVPSFRNSGFETTATGCPVPASMISLTRAAVPTGTVLLVTTILPPFMARAMSSATAKTWLRSAPPSDTWGVPTAMKTASACVTASARSVEKESLPSRVLRSISSSSPNS